MNKVISFLGRAFLYFGELCMALSVALAIFIFVIMGLIEFYDFACYVLDTYRSGHV